MGEDDIIRRWMGFELHRLNEANVLAARPLSDVAAMKEPKLPTRSGEHLFDREALGRLRTDLPILLHHRLRVPLTFYTPHDLPGETYVEDAAAVEALQALGGATTQPREGKLWMGLAFALAFAERYPTCVQFTAL